VRASVGGVSLRRYAVHRVVHCAVDSLALSHWFTRTVSTQEKERGGGQCVCHVGFVWRCHRLLMRGPSSSSPRRRATTLNSRPTCPREGGDEGRMAARRWRRQGGGNRVGARGLSELITPAVSLPRACLGMADDVRKVELWL
jgi:hypothetical protein